MLIENSMAAIAVLIVFSLKVISVAGLSAKFRQPSDDRLAAWLLAWLVIQAATFAYMLLLSPFDALTPLSMWLWFIALCLLGLGGLERPGRLDASSIGFGVLLATMALRSIVLFDYSADASSYGYPRLGIWMNWQSLLIHMPTEQVNIFCNEWSGELICLEYGLVSNNLQGFLFGSVESLLVLFLGIKWLASRLGALPSWSSAIGLILASCPISLGLASTVKGDLLASAAIPIAVGGVMLSQQYPGIGLAIAVAASFLGAGSKISSAICLAPLGLSVMLLVVRHQAKWRAWGGLAVGLICGSLYCSRYFINWFVYGNPIVRAGGEHAEASLTALLRNSWLMAVRFFWGGANREPFESWALSAGMGTCMTVVALTVGAYFFSKRQVSSRTNFLLAGIAMLTLIVSLGVLPPTPWTLRYVLPVVFVMLVALLSLGRVVVTTWVATGIMLLSIANVWIVARPGEILPPTRAIPYAEHFVAFANRSSLERSLMLYMGQYELYRVDELGLDEMTPKRIVCVHQCCTPYQYFLGSRLQNRITLVRTKRELAEKIRTDRPELVSVSHFRYYNDKIQAVIKLGYHCVNEFGELVKVKQFVPEEMASKYPASLQR